jgi:hypothetical protein
MMGERLKWEGFSAGLSIASKVRCKQGEERAFAFFFLAWDFFFVDALLFSCMGFRGLLLLFLAGEEAPS